MRPDDTPAALRWACISLGVAGLGFLVYGERIFAFRFAHFQLVVLGPVIGMFVVAAPRVRARWLAAMALGTWVVLAATAGSRTPALLLRDAVGVVAVAAGAVICGASRRRLPQAWPARLALQVPLWAGIITVAELAAIALLATVRSLPLQPEAIRLVAVMGALAGAGAALGDVAAGRLGAIAGWGGRARRADV
ncbi:MAG: hypothetical protein R6X35_03340 [Candidatus Krumholzibacteriia bacterium]